MTKFKHSIQPYLYSSLTFSKLGTIPELPLSGSLNSGIYYLIIIAQTCRLRPRKPFLFCVNRPRFPLDFERSLINGSSQQPCSDFIATEELALLFYPELMPPTLGRSPIGTRSAMWGTNTQDQFTRANRRGPAAVAPRMWHPACGTPCATQKLHLGRHRFVCSSSGCQW
jgi:hypothetical protein